MTHTSFVRPEFRSSAHRSAGHTRLRLAASLLVAVACLTLPPSVLPSNRASAQEAASSSTPAASAPSIARLASGGSLRLPDGWTADAGQSGGVLMLSPPAADVAADLGLLGMFGVEPWDPTTSISSPESIARLREQFLAVMPGFTLDGEPNSTSNEVRMQFAFRGDQSAEVRLHVFLRTVENRRITLAVAGPADVIRERAATWESMFVSASIGTEPNESDSASSSGDRPTSEATMKELLNPQGGYALRHPPAWTVRTEGMASALFPDAATIGSPNAECYALNAMPWQAGKSLDVPANAELAAQELLAEAPGLRRNGEIEMLGGGGVLLRCVASGDDGQIAHIAILAKNNDRTLVALVTGADAQTIAARESTARQLFTTIRFVEPKAAAAAAAGNLDRPVIGRWSTDEVLSSGSGWDSAGVTSMVTQRILNLEPNGTFTLGSRSAGGNSDVSFDSSFEVDARGTWRCEGNERGNYILFTNEDGSTDRARYVMHEGQLVLGESGSRKFYSRIR
jgi:hypothetical protein